MSTQRRKRLGALMLAAVVLLGGAATWALKASKGSQDAAARAGAETAAAKPALTVTVTQPQRTDMATTVSANGNIAAWQEAVVGAEANGLRLAEVRVNVGDVVRRGQVLATFVADMVRADVAQSLAGVAEAEATLAEATANAQRARGLQASGALSAQQINQYLTAEHTAQARLEAQRAAAKVQQLRLAQTQVLAPDGGVISSRSATVGAVVPAGQELFRLIRQGRLEWRAEVAASELALLRPGMAVQVTPAGGTAVAGRLRMVAPTVDASTRNGLVYVDLPMPGGASAGDAPGGANSGRAPGGAKAGTAPGGARAGMFARGEFAVGTSRALTLPQTAVLLRDGFSYVFKVGVDHKVAQVKVTVGRRVGERIEITGGLDPAARVVASGAGFLGDGDAVRVVEAAPPAAAVAGN